MVNFHDISGLPLALDQADLLELNDGLIMENSAPKYAGDMISLLKDPSSCQKETVVYRFYRAIGFPEHREIFEHHQLRYDITTIMPGKCGDEFHKTSGHFHKPIDGKQLSYPELYEVIQGTALFTLQRVADLYADMEDLEVVEVLIAKVTAGQKIVIPPLYWHNTTNAGNDVLVFSNLVSEHSANEYDSVAGHCGMAYYITDSPDGISLQANRHYVNPLPEPEIIKPSQSVKLHLTDGHPVYTSFLEKPEAFDYLTEPEAYLEEMRQSLVPAALEG